MRVAVRPLVLLALVATGLLAGACGNKQEEITRGETEANYLDVGKLKYQVQISRQLNPADAEDRSYLLGVDPAERDLAPQESWFAIFLRVENQTDEPQQSAQEFEIRDTQGKVFRPIELPPENVFAYQPVSVPPGRSIPELDSASAENTIQGALVLFKIPYANLENRPLEFEVRDPASPDRVATVDLDV